MSSLTVGGLTIDREVATAHARDYLTHGKSKWAYPAYDTYDRGHATGPLTDADLLAPLLLNVNRISIATYEALQARVPELQAVLDQIPVDLSLREAGAAHLNLLGQLFAVLDGSRIRGARGTVLSKLLHRKRPAFIPLYDKKVGWVYQDSGTGAPVPRSKAERPWAEFAVLYAAAVQRDLDAAWETWQEITTFARPDARITPLRALDIVAWRAGSLAEQAR